MRNQISLYDTCDVRINWNDAETAGSIAEIIRRYNKYDIGIRWDDGRIEKKVSNQIFTNMDRPIFRVVDTAIKVCDIGMNWTDSEVGSPNIKSGSTQNKYDIGIRWDDGGITKVIDPMTRPIIESVGIQNTYDIGINWNEGPYDSISGVVNSCSSHAIAINWDDAGIIGASDSGFKVCQKIKIGFWAKVKNAMSYRVKIVIVSPEEIAKGEKSLVLHKNSVFKNLRKRFLDKIGVLKKREQGP